MALMITSSSSSFNLTYHGKVKKGQPTLSRSKPYNYFLHRNISLKRNEQDHSFLKNDAKFGISLANSRSNDLRAKASASPNSPSSPWQKWLLGLLLTVILPALGYKGGLFTNLKGKIDKAVKTVEHVAEVVEEIAEEAEKIVEEVEEKLPEDTNIRQRLESFDDLAHKAVDEAKKAEGVVLKVKAEEEEIENELKNAASKAQVKK